MLGGRQNVLQKIAGSGMKYFRHVESLPDCRFPYNYVASWMMDVFMGRGHPRKKWLDNVREDCERAGLTLTQAVREVLLLF